ncbi:MAG TPA: hypothetical protein VJ841_00825 [Candidatus Saccharimonadales bacterium]|nr:hypothetical protein [Candidatus Saccharimonadales bacterium]
MYSGTTIRTKSGRIIGVHQKIDRIARRHLSRQIPTGFRFPSIREILHFEGLNGPDGIKRKSPSRDEPWHFIDPLDPTDTALIVMIEDHIFNLSRALREENIERASFEAAWLAHAIVDGLTPAHHYPFEEKLEELRGEGMETRSSIRDKVLLPGKSRRAQLRNNWEFWGAKGVMTTHVAFELGVATAIAPLKFDDAMPTDADYDAIRVKGFTAIYRQIMQSVATLDMYKEFSRKGWTQQMAKQARSILVPQIIRAVTLAWYAALVDAQGGLSERTDH